MFDVAGEAQGWCQYATPEKLGLKHTREYEKDPPPTARWRIACSFVDKRHRGVGVARRPSRAQIAQIAQAGGATVERLEDLGFTRLRPVGKHAWVVSREVPAAAP